MGGVEKLNIKHKPSNHRRKQRIFLKGKKKSKKPLPRGFAVSIRHAEGARQDRAGMQRETGGSQG